MSDPAGDPYWVLSVGCDERLRPSQWPKPHPQPQELRQLAKRHRIPIGELRAADREGAGADPTPARLRALRALRDARWVP